MLASTQDRRPNYVQTLDRERRAFERELRAWEQGMHELARYLTSTKFATDRSVNRDDVLLRIDETRARALQAGGEA